MVKPLSSLLLALFVTCALSAGCGGGIQSIRVSGEFTAEHAELFEDGFDFVKEPASLDGKWLQSWQQEIQKRVDYSDLVAVVTVNTLRTDVDPERQTSYRVVAEIERRIYGGFPDAEIELTVDENAVGYASVKENQELLLNRVFVAYVRWYETEAGEIAGHWHLSPASDGVVGATEKLVKERTEQKKEMRRKVVVHKHTD